MSMMAVMAARFYRIARGAKRRRCIGPERTMKASVAWLRRLRYPCGPEVPMSYVQRVLQPGEVIRHTTNIHWIVYKWGVLFLLLALVTFIFGEVMTSRPVYAEVVACLFAVIGLALLFWEWGKSGTTEIAVTDRRVIHKEGFIRRDTNEMNLDKVESVQVKQSILGRILDYGHVTIIGIGEGETELRMIAHPIDLRNYITGVISHA
jgi:protein-S-isoprenylcysteine O-methyltransferase Ste14